MLREHLLCVELKLVLARTTEAKSPSVLSTRTSQASLLGCDSGASQRYRQRDLSCSVDKGQPMEQEKGTKPLRFPQGPLSMLAKVLARTTEAKSPSVLSTRTSQASLLGCDSGASQRYRQRDLSCSVDKGQPMEQEKGTKPLRFPQGPLSMLAKGDKRLEYRPRGLLVAISEPRDDDLEQGGHGAKMTTEDPGPELPLSPVLPSSTCNWPGTIEGQPGQAWEFGGGGMAGLG
ncbi:hypothetical protein TREES_T100009398 [Tupaia chinensis]|uniref:Uncharacterized protein n=1 Tax=Tupaia chinensis TaxID=246437 RepID=L9JDW5_TUPCH|nr:hypothetical protein TREES_T100009398 [Tupaia chinensis]